jgi:hypothetical protein
MGSVVYLVVDVLKPYDPSLVDFAERLEEADAVDRVSVNVLERDDEVQNVEVSLQGEDIDQERITEIVENQGASVHSVDQVICGQPLNGVERLFSDRPSAGHE